MMNLQAVDFCRSIGVDIEEFLPSIRKDLHENAAIYLSGSLVEAFGNSTSDLDVFVVSDHNDADAERCIKKDLMSIDMIFGRQRRIDVEYWTLAPVLKFITPLTQLDIPVDFVAERIDERQELFIHRLLCSMPMFDTAAYRELLGTIAQPTFRRYMIKRTIHKIDGAALDLKGMLAKGDRIDALLRIFDIIDLSVDAYRFARGMTNPMPKWRVRSLEALRKSHPAESERAGAVLAYFLKHRVQRSGVSEVDDAAVTAYARDVLYWSDCLIRDLYE
jgi:predicted nucleotidyltransferase